MKSFIDQIKQILPTHQVIEDELLRYAYSTDASMYRMIPQLVILAEQENDVYQIIKLAQQHNTKLTFRAAGTSLSGQAVTDQVLVVLANHCWQNYHISVDGKQITLEPGIIGATANNYLCAYHRKIGPDPASISAAKIGGIIANNSSGMCCGTAQNSYATIASLRAIMANSSLFNSADPQQNAKFTHDNQELIANIRHIRHQINADLELSNFIRKKFAIKNTSGYSLNAFLDYDDPIKIIEHLLIGSEGTLGFISQVTFNTVVDEPYKALNLVFGSLKTLCDLTIQISQYQVSAVELLDPCSLRSVAHIKELQPYLPASITDDTAAIMIEISSINQAELQNKVDKLQEMIGSTEIISESKFTQDLDLINTLWKARKGVLPTVAGQRALGSSVLIEDVAVMINDLPALVDDLQKMFKRYNYSNAAIFGHVLAGNIHFVLTPNFTIEQELSDYDKFMQEFTDLVAIKYQGSLKAEHGSGRNIAPFALVEWGQQCWDIMWRIKELFDPQNIFNPDVKLTLDNTLHMHNLKQLPAIDPQIDSCMECGFCEPICPSRNLSLTPRQRNAVARYLPQLDVKQRKRWLKQYQYYGIDTCATTGMCQTVCPVNINTGEYILSLKPDNSKELNHAGQIKAARNKIAKANMVANIIGKHNLQAVTQSLHGTFKSIPVYLESMPKVVNQLKSNHQNAPVMLIPSCPSRVFASNHGYSRYASQMILEKMGYAVSIPKNYADLCCGQIYHSQGNHKQQDLVQQKLRNTIADAQIVLMDNSSCASFAKQSGIDVMDINQFVVERIIRSKLFKRYQKIALHIDCSSAKGCFNPEFMKILKLCAYEVVIPDGIKCCGFAGDKGFTTPELNASSLSDLAKQVADCELGVTFNRNCQIGLNQHSGIKYISFVELVLDCLQV